MLFRAVVVAFKIVAIGIEYFSDSLDVSLIPLSLYFGAVRESYNPKAALFAIDKPPSIDSAVAVVVDPLSIFFAIAPHSSVDVSVRVCHSSLAKFDVVPPLALVYVTIGIVINSKTLLSIFDCAFETFSVSEQVSPLEQ